MREANAGIMTQGNRSQGFTLIELVVVITILGILAAVALPRFADLSSDAEESAAKGIKSSLQAAVNLAHSKAMVSDGDVKMGGKTIAVNSSNWPSTLDDALNGLQTNPVNQGWDKNDGCGSTMPNGETATGCIENAPWQIGYENSYGQVAITDSNL